ncbi:MAG: phosphoribosylformylglycinamidine synthase, purS protein [Candidatus Marinimicrobia bacterium]|nr:phosphoribosylformylglycinamidine synthase, purS protein [Candidatus Neomarinimicrobiota bacterium]|tara:strand:- start:32689 stop:32934 length:246 start_codon:yes stop_codon:yes gene_type:complete
MKAKIFIKYKEGILDPQGTVTNKALKSINIKGIDSMGIGKYIEIDFDKSVKKDDAISITKDSCNKLLVNPNTETYTFEIEE